MRLPHVEDRTGLDVAIVGVPFDGGTSYRPGARLGPREIRTQSSLIRAYSYFQKVAPFDRLNVADVGDVDAPPVSIEKCYEAVEARIGAIADAGAADGHRRRPLDLAADSARAGEAARAAGAGAVRRAYRHLGRVLRRQVLPRHAVPPRDRGRDHRREAVHPGRHPRADVRRRGLRVPSRARHHDARHRPGEGRAGRRGSSTRSAGSPPARPT